MPSSEAARVGYIVKRYPRYSETFVVNELLAHQAAGLETEIFSLYPPNDTHFQDSICQVRAPVTYVLAEGLKPVEFWTALEETTRLLPDMWARLEAARGEEARCVYQAVVVAGMAVQKGIHHLHAHFANCATTVARLAAHFAGVTYSFTAHAKDIFHESVQPADLRRKLAEAAAVVTVSDYNRTYLCQRYGPAAARVQRLYNGLDLRRFQFSSADHRPPRIMAVGRLVEKKGFPQLIEACALLVAAGRRFTCQIIGTGPQEGELRAQIQSQALGDCVELLGARPQCEVIRLVQEAAVFVAPCIVGSDGNRDGVPTVLLEAMALGTPCISTDVTGIPEVVRHGHTGLIVPQHDPRALAAAIEQLLSNPDLRARLAARARSLIEREFDVHRNAAQLREIFATSLPRKVAMGEVA
jgi:colanic acid/amylovoran biosynthesis glycosyltransferase